MRMMINSIVTPVKIPLNTIITKLEDSKFCFNLQGKKIEFKAQFPSTCFSDRYFEMYFTNYIHSLKCALIQKSRVISLKSVKK